MTATSSEREHVVVEPLFLRNPHVTPVTLEVIAGDGSVGYLMLGAGAKVDLNTWAPAMGAYMDDYRGEHDTSA